MIIQLLPHNLLLLCSLHNVLLQLTGLGGPHVRPKRLIEECNIATYALSCAEDVEGSARPSNYSEAITSADCINWVTTMQDEMESLEKNGT